ncbi:MAG: hypothetical protein NC314_11540 [Roseburia sp.]|nr:hypothetical protein [Roseburia sp.]MCM1243465.1 hypothetical protein [Roseburia sp.]
MKRKIVTVLLASGLVLGVCGCGGGGSSSAASTPVAEEDHAPADIVEPVIPEEPESVDAASEGYSFDELVEMWSSGTLLREEIVEMAMAGEIDYDVFEEFLAFADEAWENENLENANVISDIDTSSLLTTYTIEFEDSDGYQIRETVQLSPIFREDDMGTVYALWEALGNDVASFPSKESIRNSNLMLTNYQLEYVVGTYMVENLTDGFPITSDNPRTYAKSLTAEGNSVPATFFNNRSVSVVMYSSGMKYYGDNLFATVIGDARMTSDTWGPRTFVIALPNEFTPNQPDGYRYDEIQVIFSYNNQGSYDRSNYDSLKLEYYTKEAN